MGADTGIAWCSHTFNPWWGCVKVSPACTNCYAESFDHRLGGEHWGPSSSRKFFGDKHWNEPLKWDRAAGAKGVRARVFCASMADVFEDRDDLHAPRARLFDLISRTPHLDWLLLTKRPENFATMLPWMVAPVHATTLGIGEHAIEQAAKPWPNVWMGTTVENQEYADLRIPLLMAARAVVRFLSVEPMLGEVDIASAAANEKCDRCGDRVRFRNLGGDNCDSWCSCCVEGGELCARVPVPDWVIVGCESGPGARSQNLDHVRGLRDECEQAGIAFFLKQLIGDPSTSELVAVGVGPGSWRKGAGLRLIEQPYLDGAQHVAFPTPRDPDLPSDVDGPCEIADPWCNAHRCPAICPHACPEGSCAAGCEERTDHELRSPR